MWLKCNKCGESWQTSKYRANEMEIGDLKNIRCKFCSSKGVEWLVIPKYKGEEIRRFRIKKMAKLSKTSEWEDSRGKIEFDPRMYSAINKDGKKILWLPYWISINGKKRYGQSSPIMWEKEFLELFINAIKGGLFSDAFIENLKKVIT